MKDLGVSAMDDPAAATFPSDHASYEHWISAECHRRTFWVLYVLESLSSAFAARPMTFKDSQLKVRLPMDEASFDFGIRKDTPPGKFLFLSWRSLWNNAERFRVPSVSYSSPNLLDGGAGPSRPGCVDLYDCYEPDYGD
jgi:hypothetical protein